MTLLWDAAVVLVIAGFAFSAFKKGFLNTIVRLLGSFVAFGVSLYYSKPIAAMIYQNYLSDKIQAAFEGALSQGGAQTPQAFVTFLDDAVALLPSYLSNLLGDHLGSQSAALYENFVSNGAEQFSGMMAQNVAFPIVSSVLQAVVFCVLFGILMLLVKALAALMTTVNLIPVVRSVNAVLGAILGIIQGVLYLYVLCAVLWLVMTVTGDGLSFLNSGIIESTTLLKHFFTIGPWAANLLKAF